VGTRRRPRLRLAASGHPGRLVDDPRRQVDLGAPAEQDLGPGAVGAGVPGVAGPGGCVDDPEAPAGDLPDHVQGLIDGDGWAAATLMTVLLTETSMARTVAFSRPAPRTWDNQAYLGQGGMQYTSPSPSGRCSLAQGRYPPADCSVAVQVVSQRKGWPMSSMGSTPLPSPTDPTVALPSLSMMLDHLMALQMADMLQQTHRLAQEALNVQNATRAKEVRAQLEKINQWAEQQKRRDEEQRRTNEQWLAAVGATIGAAIGVLAAAETTKATSGVATPMLGAAITSTTLAVNQLAASGAATQAKQLQSLAEKITAMVQQQQQAMKTMTESQQAVLKQMAATVQQQMAATLQQAQQQRQL
jgi:hypothetical protein